ncbi:Pseudooxynicotine oxidase [compost metagenome]
MSDSHDQDANNGVSRRKFIRNIGVTGAAAAVAASSVGAMAAEKGETCKTAGCDYDVIVVGGGFSGISAARDSRKNGYKTLVLEARNRLGGRTFSSEFAGHKIELGGTWIHWAQPFVWAEVERYGLQVKETPEGVESSDATYTMLVNGERKVLQPAEFGPAIQALNDYFKDARTLWPRVYDTRFSWDQVVGADTISCAEKLDQMKLTPLQRTFVDSYLGAIVHSPTDKGSYVETLRWWALAYHDFPTLHDTCGRYTFVDGTRSLIEAMVDDGKPEIRLSTPVTRVEQIGERVKVTTQKGDSFTAAAVIVAVPMNVLPRIEFSPALDPAVVEAGNERHSGSGTKVFIRTRGKLNTPGKIYGLADSYQPVSLLMTYAKAEDHTILIGFGCDPEKLDVQDRDSVQQVVSSFYPELEVEQCYGYEWTLDPYSRGTYCTYKPKWYGKYYDHFMKDKGRVLFSTGDHGDGWHGFIDGAIGSGLRAANRARKLLG